MSDRPVKPQFGWRLIPRPLLRYAFAILTVAVAMGVRLAITAWFGPGLPPNNTFYPAVMIVALLAGFGPGVVATLLAAMITIYWILPPHGWSVTSPVDRLAMLFFTGTGLFMSTVAGLYRRTRAKATAYDREAALGESHEALSASEERYRTLFTSMEEGFCIAEVLLDADARPIDFRFLEINGAFEKQTGLKDAKGRRRRELVPQLEEDWFEIFAKIALTGEPLRFEHEAAAMGRWYEVHAFRVGEPASRRVAIIVNDITVRRQAEETVRQLNVELEERVRQRTAELEAANRELEAFSYSVAHDLRAPLRSIDGFSAAILQEYGAKLDAAGHEYLRFVRAGCQRMGLLIDDLLKLSRLTRAPLRREPVDLTALAQRIVADLRHLAPERVVQCRIAEGLTTAGDPSLLEAALRNLLENAWKFTAGRAEAVIEVGACEPANGAAERGAPVFFIRDNGAGFDMQYADKLFGVFQRLHREEEFEGTGVGLATVQRIVERHGGRVWAEAVVNRGATFYFTLNEKPPTP